MTLIEWAERLELAGVQYVRINYDKGTWQVTTLGHETTEGFLVDAMLSLLAYYEQEVTKP